MSPRMWTVAGTAGVAIVLITAFTVAVVVVLRGPAIEAFEWVEDGRPCRVMTIGDIRWGMNFVKPPDARDWGDPRHDFSRLATTYYHRFGPLGRAMERYCWFNDQENCFNSDSRIAASLVAAAAPWPGVPLPTEALAALWSEPPVAVIGLEAGTIASYARPYQHLHFYEADKRLRDLSLRKQWPIDVNYLFFRDNVDPTRPDASASKTAPHFTYLRDALARGAHVQAHIGDPLQRLAAPYHNYYADPHEGGGPDAFYQVIVLDDVHSERTAARFLTKHAMEAYFRHLTEDGILCVHASGRNLDLPLVVGDLAAELGFAAKTGTDPAPYGKTGHLTSEWVMVARKAQYMRYLSDPPGFREAIRARKVPLRPMWTVVGR